jgi:hypothetical protein
LTLRLTAPVSKFATRNSANMFLLNASISRIGPPLLVLLLLLLTWLASSRCCCCCCCGACSREPCRLPLTGVLLALPPPAGCAPLLLLLLGSDTPPLELPLSDPPPPLGLPTAAADLLAEGFRGLFSRLLPLCGGESTAAAAAAATAAVEPPAAIPPPPTAAAAVSAAAAAAAAIGPEPLPLRPCAERRCSPVLGEGGSGEYCPAPPAAKSFT